MIYDLIIIGAGPAGLSAAIYGARKKINLVVLSSDIGGQTTEAHLVENYLGMPNIPGTELVDKFRQHAKMLGVKIKEGVDVRSIEKTEKGIFKLTTARGDFEAKAVIVATGKTYRRLTVPGAKEFEGRGITYCATCDAPLFKNKTVAVIGAGDAGQDAVWQLTQYASKIYLLNKYAELRGDDIVLQEELKKHPKVEIYNQCEPLGVKGDKFVRSLAFKHNHSNETREVRVDGVFVEIGSVPVCGYLKDVVKLNEAGEIIIDPKTNMTSAAGIFAAGDVTNVSHKQMIVAAGEGAKAALSAYEYLKIK